MANQDFRPLLPVSPKDFKRLWSYIVRKGPADCWLWTGSTVKGYGHFCYGPKYEKRQFYTHRIVYFLEYGIDPGANLVLHRCDQPLCQNPSHLFLGTPKDNMQDCLSKDRFPTGDRHYLRINPELILRGENHPNRIHPENMARGERVAGSKLKDADVVEIRKLYASGWLLREIAPKFGMSQASISLIVRRKYWAHVK